MAHICLFAFQFGAGKGNVETEMWIGYCSFHLGDYKKAMSVYEALSHNKNPPEDVPVNLACCYFYLGMYPEAERVSIMWNPQQEPLKSSIHQHCDHIRSMSEKWDC